MLEDDEDDIVFFAFPNQKKKIKCSISMLTEISIVFDAMFKNRWIKEETKDVDAVQPQPIQPQQDKIIQLEDDVHFNQYSTFKLLMQILYGLRRMDSLTVDQATSVFYYAHKYDINDIEENIKKHLNERMESGMSKLPFTVSELTEGVEFAQTYHLDKFKKKLDEVKLDFDEENLNAIQFWDISIRFGMKMLQQQIVDHMMHVPPKKEWPFDLLLAVTDQLQIKIERTAEAVLEAKCSCGELVNLYCDHCDKSMQPSSFFESFLN